MSDQLREVYPLVSIVSINYNQLKITYEMLDSIRRQDYPNVQIIVVDNASSEDPRDQLHKDYPEVEVIRSNRNLGFSGGNNLGIQAAKGEYIFLVNNDTELSDGLIAILIQRFEAIPDLGIVSPLICYGKQPGKADVIQYAGATRVSNITARNQILGEGELNTGQYAEPVDTAYVHGAAMMIPRTVLEQVGNMPEIFFLYYEELDWSEKIRRSGYRIQVEPGAVIYHKESVTTGSVSPMKTYYLTRNRILFMRRNRSTFEVVAFFLFFSLVTMPRWIITYTIKRQWRHLAAFLYAIRWHFIPKDPNFVCGPDQHSNLPVSRSNLTKHSIQS